MIGDEMGEKVVTYGFRVTGKLTLNALKGVLKLIIGKPVGGVAHLAHKGIHQAIGTNQKTLEKIGKEGHQIQGIEVEKSQLKGFDWLAKKYHLEYSLKRESNDPEHCFLSFKAMDMSKLEMVWRDLEKNKTIDHGDLGEKIEQAKEKAFNINKAREQEKEKTKTKSKSKDRGMER